MITDFQTVQAEYNRLRNSAYVSADELMTLCDLTLLKQDAEQTAIQTLVNQAITHKTAAICVFPEHLKWIGSAAVKRATVLNFPTGNLNTVRVLTDLEQIITTEQIDEIDCVLPYAHYLQGDTISALKLIELVLNFCQQHHKKIKVILETSAFPSYALIAQVSKELAIMGCDFVKSSTGTSTEGATLEAAHAILSGISGSNCGIKVSGGIRNMSTASDYYILAQMMSGNKPTASWFRIGTSSLFHEG